MTKWLFKKVVLTYYVLSQEYNQILPSKRYSDYRKL